MTRLVSDSKKFWREAWSTDVVVAGGGLLLRAFVQAGVFVLIARGLGPEAYGSFVALVAIATLLVPCLTIGHEFLVLRTLAVDGRAPWQAVAGGIAKTALLAPAIIGAVAFACAVWMPQQVSFAIAVSVLVADALLGAWLEIAWRTFQGLERMPAVALIRLMPSMSRLIAAVLLCSSAGALSLSAWVFAYLIASIVASAAVFIVLVQILGRPVVELSFRLVWLEGVPFAVNALAERATNDIDKALLSGLDGARSAGLYGAAYRLVEIAVVPLSAVVMSANARLFRAGNAGIEHLEPLLRRLLSGVLAYGLIAGCLVFVTAPIFARVLGPEFSKSVEMMRWLAAFPLLVGFRVVLGAAVAAVGCQALRARVQLAAAFAALGLCVVLIPLLGWIGAAISTLLIEVGAALAFYRILNGHRIGAPVG